MIDRPIPPSLPPSTYSLHDRPREESHRGVVRGWEKRSQALSRGSEKALGEPKKARRSLQQDARLQRFAETCPPNVQLVLSYVYPELDRSDRVAGSGAGADKSISEVPCRHCDRCVTVCLLCLIPFPLFFFFFLSLPRSARLLRSAPSWFLELAQERTQEGKTAAKALKFFGQATPESEKKEKSDRGVGCDETSRVVQIEEEKAQVEQEKTRVEQEKAQVEQEKAHVEQEKAQEAERLSQEIGERDEEITELRSKIASLEVRGARQEKEKPTRAMHDRSTDRENVPPPPLHTCRTRSFAPRSRTRKSAKISKPSTRLMSRPFRNR